MKRFFLITFLSLLSFELFAIRIVKKAEDCVTQDEAVATFFNHQNSYGEALYEMNAKDGIKFFEGIHESCLKLFLEHPASEAYKTTYLESLASRYGKEALLKTLHNYQEC
jgi:hypothetical protein